jgi:hypothetical protein
LKAQEAPARWGAVVVAALAGMLTAACSSPSAAGIQVKPTPSASASPSPSASPPPSAAAGPIAPLTGLPASRSVADRPAVAVPLTGSRPRGLADADVVYEEITSPLRYIAVFQSRQARVIGPVGSTRPADGQILSVLRPLFGYDGGTAAFITVLDHTRVVDLGYPAHSSLYQDGSAGLSTSTRALIHAAHAPAPPELFSYRSGTPGDALATAGQFRASAVTIEFPGGYGTQRWVFDSRRDLWREVAGGPPVAVANLIIQKVPYKTVYLSRKYNLTVPTARVLGRGGTNSVEAFSGIADSAATGPRGLAARGEWSKPGLRYVTDFLDTNDFPMDFQPGPTWIVLAPAGTTVRTSGTAS